MHEKTNNLGSDQVPHKPGWAVHSQTHNDKRLEILDLESGGTVLLCSENKSADQLYCEADFFFFFFFSFSFTSLSRLFQLI